MDYNHGIFLRRFLFLVCWWKAIEQKTIATQISKIESAEPMFLKKIYYTFAAIILIEKIYQVFPKSHGEDYIYDQQVMKTW